MKTTADTRSLMDLARSLSRISVPLATRITTFTSDLIDENTKLNERIKEQQTEIINLSKANGELGVKVADVFLETKPEIDKLKKVVKLLVAFSTKELQKKMGPEIVTLIMEHPEKFVSDMPSTLMVASPAETEQKDDLING